MGRIVRRQPLGGGTPLRFPRTTIGAVPAAIRNVDWPLLIEVLARAVNENDGRKALHLELTDRPRSQFRECQNPLAYNGSTENGTEFTDGVEIDGLELNEGLFDSLSPIVLANRNHSILMLRVPVHMGPSGLSRWDWLPRRPAVVLTARSPRNRESGWPDRRAELDPRPRDRATVGGRHRVPLLEQYRIGGRECRHPVV